MSGSDGAATQLFLNTLASIKSRMWWWHARYSKFFYSFCSSSTQPHSFCLCNIKFSGDWGTPKFDQKMSVQILKKEKPSSNVIKQNVEVRAWNFRGQLLRTTLLCINGPSWTWVFELTPIGGGVSLTLVGMDHSPPTSPFVCVIPVIVPFICVLSRPFRPFLIFLHPFTLHLLLLSPSLEGI